MTVAGAVPVQKMSGYLDTMRSELAGLTDSDLVHMVRDIEELSRRAYSVMLDTVAEVEARGIAAQEGFGSTARLLAGMLRLSSGEARARVEHAAALGARRALTGEPLAPKLPATAAALATGEIGTGQVRVITETLALLPASVPEPVRAQVEADLAAHARDFDPRRLRIIATRVLGTLDPDGPEPADEPSPAAPVRGELWLRPRRGGRLGIEGWLDAEHGTMVRALIEQLAAPRPAGTDANGTPVRDRRSVPERQADALIELCERARGAEDFPTTGGEPPHLAVTIDWEALRAALGTATLDYGQQLSAAEVRRMACDAKLIPLVLGTDSEPLDVGRTARTAPLGLRRALAARDKGCTFPGCDRPPARCAVHHVQHWIDHGMTAVCNCCLLCDLHHQQVHRQNWEITIVGGRVEFRPPALVDPERRPLTNPLRQ